MLYMNSLLYFFIFMLNHVAGLVLHVSTIASTCAHYKSIDPPYLGQYWSEDILSESKSSLKLNFSEGLFSYKKSCE